MRNHTPQPPSETFPPAPFCMGNKTQAALTERLKEYGEAYGVALGAALLPWLTWWFVFQNNKVWLLFCITNQLFWMLRIIHTSRIYAAQSRSNHQALRDLEAGFDKSLLHMMLDSDWNILHIGQGFSQLLNEESRSIAGQKALFLIKSLSESATFEAIDKGLKKGYAWRGEVRFLTGKQEEKWGMFSIIPLGGGVSSTSASNPAWLVLGFDITYKHVQATKLKLLSAYDDLTELSNRRSFDQIIEREWLRMKRQKNHLSIIIMDVDYFKKYNDFYGHMKGDECLKKVAKAFHDTLRRSGDWVTRFGGEEFAAILPNTDANGALEVAEKLRWAVLNLKIPHAKSEAEPYVTVSAGVSSTIPTEHVSIVQLLETADEALYWAKSQGRNTSRVKPLSSEPPGMRSMP